jgi:hypothetical protein
MKTLPKSSIAVGVAASMSSQAVVAETDEERIRRLESIVEKQRQMLQALTDEVR